MKNSQKKSLTIDLYGVLKTPSQAQTAIFQIELPASSATDPASGLESGFNRI
jgi:hypothetical protein